VKGLLRADLQQIGNLARTREGRKLLLLLLFAQAFFLFAGAILGALLEQPAVRDGVRAGTTDPALPAGLVLMPTVLVLLRIALGSSARQLFAGPEVPLLLSSPVPAVHLVLRGLWRLTAGVLFWCLGFSAVALFLGAQVRMVPTAALWRLPLAMTLMALPPLALVQMVYALAMRFAASRFTQLLFSAVGSVAMLAFFFLVIRGEHLAKDGRELSFLVESFQSGWLWRVMLAGPAAFLVRGGGQALSSAWLLGGLAVTALSCAVTAGVYRSAFENSISVSAAASRAGGSRRRWPSGLFASLIRKEWLSLAQQPARLVGLALSASVLGWLAMQQHRGGFLQLSLPPPVGDRWFDGLRAGGALLGLAAKLALFVLPSFSLSVFQGESKQWPLIAASPADRRAFLLAKAGAAGLMLTPYLIVVGVVGWTAGLPAHAYLVFLAFAPPTLAALAAPMIAFGCSPFLMRPAEEGELGPRLRTGLGLAVIYLVLMVLLTAGYLLWSLGVGWLERRLLVGGDAATGLMIFGGAWWLFADLLIWLCWRAACRNAERYFAARG